jgi:monothiol glutaredoxin
MTTNPPTVSQAVIDEINREIAENRICIFSKGTKDAPRCGFTMQTAQFFNQLGLPFEMFDVVENPDKRQALNEMTNWPTLPKIFISGKFYGDMDIIGEMLQNGEFEQVIRQTFPEYVKAEA